MTTARTVEVVVDGEVFYRAVFNSYDGLQYSVPEVGFGISIGAVHRPEPKPDPHPHRWFEKDGIDGVFCADCPATWGVE